MTSYIMSCCKTGEWVRVSSLAEASRTARIKGFKDFEVEVEK